MVCYIEFKPQQWPLASIQLDDSRQLIVNSLEVVLPNNLNDNFFYKSSFVVLTRILDMYCLERWHSTAFLCLVAKLLAPHV